jgi:hypothetical protein
MLGRPPAPAEDVRDTTPTPPSPATPDLPDASSRGAESHSSRSDASDQERRPTRPNRVSPDVAALFDEIAPVYDRLSSVLSLWRDGRWRSAAVEATGVRAGDSTIDVAAGTGKLAAAPADRVGPPRQLGLRCESCPIPRPSSPSFAASCALAAGSSASNRRLLGRDGGAASTMRASTASRRLPGPRPVGGARIAEWPPQSRTSATRERSSR